MTILSCIMENVGSSVFGRLADSVAFNPSCKSAFKFIRANHLCATLNYIGPL